MIFPDPKPFTVVVPFARAIEIGMQVDGRLNDAEFRGWRPRSITLHPSCSRRDDDGNSELTLMPIPCSYTIDVVGPGPVQRFEVREAVDFSFIESLPGYTPAKPRVPTATW